ncbi:MAG: TetR/AcrR family transcriptional regulator [Rhodospirillales bacterium]|nr:TetR/AcrR family transcriptional regulator [Rhodospirillales bacterium]
MARPLSFDPEQALDRAILLFWRDGFAQVSIQAITDALGINRPSLYATFGDKEALFLKALLAYRARYPGRALDALRTARPGRAQLVALFEAVRDAYTEPGLPPGCMMMCATMEWSKEGPVLDLLQSFRNEFIAGLRQAVDAAQRLGEIAPDKDPEALTQYLIFTIRAVAMEARATKDRPHVARMIDQALGSL